MELKIKKITNHQSLFYSEDNSFQPLTELPTHTEIEFTLSNKGKLAEITLSVPAEELRRYNSVPDYEATAWDYLRDILKGLE